MRIQILLVVLLAAVPAFALDLSTNDIAVQQKPVYIPPHTAEDLDTVTRWAVGGAYMQFARYAGVGFDREAYMADCPNLPLFGFSLYTGSAYLRRDLLLQNMNKTWELAYLFNLNKEAFPEVYLRMIKGTEFHKYVIYPSPTLIDLNQ